MDFNEFAERSIESVYELLTRVARERKTISYKKLAQSAGVPDADKPYIWFSYLPGVLDEINRCEHEVGRPLLSAVVVNKRKRIPGRGFFGLAEQLHLLSEDSNDDERNLFHDIELHSVYGEFAPRHQGEKQEDLVKKYCGAMWNVLVEIARERRTVTCIDLARRANLPAGLRETKMQQEFISLIDTTEWSNDRPLLGAVVVDGENGIPRKAFYESAQLIGLLPHGAENETCMQYWANELQRVYATWAE